MTDWRYLGSVGLAGVLVFVCYNRIANHGTFLATFDAVGLNVFTVTGMGIALNAGLGPTPATLLGMLTGVIATQIGFSGVPAEILAAIATFTLRMVNLRKGWRIPIAMPKSTEKD